MTDLPRIVAALATAAATPAQAGERVDSWLRTAAAVSQRDAKRLCQAAAVALDSVAAAATDRARAGSILQWCAETVPLSLSLGIAVAFADDDVLVLQKPAGLAAHRGPLVDDSVAQRLELAVPGAGLAHRLDRPASGLLLVGRHTDALRQLAAAMEGGAIARDYLAIASGVVAADAQTIDLPLRATDEPRGDRPKVVVDREQGQPAITHVRVLDRRADCSLLQVTLGTGRTHQIRAHLAAIGHPLLGDPRYGDAAANARARATFGIDRVMLHGHRLVFPLPRGGCEVEVAAFHPADFATVFRSLRPRH